MKKIFVKISDTAVMAWLLRVADSAGFLLIYPDAGELDLASVRGLFLRVGVSTPQRCVQFFTETVDVPSGTGASECTPHEALEWVRQHRIAEAG